MSIGRVVPLRAEDGDIADIPTRLERLTVALKAPEIAKVLGVGRTVVYEMAATGRIPHFKLGTMIRFDPVEIARWLREREIGSARGATSNRSRGNPAASEPREQRHQRGGTAA